MKRNLCAYSFYFLFLIAIIDLVNLQFRRGYDKESWQITEWLINYQGGFVRRGLFGEMIYRLHSIFNLDPYQTIIVISLVSFLLLSGFFILTFLRKGYPLVLLTFVFFMGGPILNDFWVRKDALSILFFASIVSIFTHKSRFRLFWINLLFIAMILVHESIGFYGLPILIVLLAQSGRLPKSTQAKSYAKSVGALMPAIVVFLVCLRNKGNYAIASKVWASWEAIQFPHQINSKIELPAAIEALYWSHQQALELGIKTLHNFSNGLWAPLVWILIIMAIYYILSNFSQLKSSTRKISRSKAIDRSIVSIVLLFQLAAMTPLFILGWDYGRWLFLWITSSFTLLVLIPENKFKNTFHQKAFTLVKKINSHLDRIFTGSIGLLPLFIGAPQYGWFLDDYLRTTPIIVVLKYLSSLVHRWVS